MIERFEYIIEEPMEIKAFLRKKLKLSSRTVIELKASGIEINGSHAKVIDYLSKGDVLTLTVKEELQKEYPPENIPLKILFENKGFIIIDKPAGMTMYPVGNHKGKSLLNAVAFYNSSIIFRPIYRLDRNTSGIVVVAKSKLTSSSVEVEKHYFAVCQGEAPKNGVINAPIGMEPGSIIKRAAGCGQKAETHFETLCTAMGHSLIMLRLKTGRTHQIRVHMASIGHPLAGDDLYGGTLNNINRHALHCAGVSINCPAVCLNKGFESGVPMDIKNAFPSLFAKNNI